MRIKEFVEFTPRGKKIKVKRFYYKDEDGSYWLCYNCHHIGKDFIIASVPCEDCQSGKTQMVRKVGRE